jgi:hypothetical protein
MTEYNINTNLTAIITEAGSNVGKFSKPGGEGVSRQTPFIQPKNFLNYGYIL